YSHVVHLPLVLADADNPIDERAEIDLGPDAALLRAGEQQHTLDDLAAALAALGDALDLLADVGLELVLEQQLRVADHTRQRVVDLVGDAGREQADRGHLLALQHLLLERPADPEIEADEHRAADLVAGAQQSASEVDRAA